MTSSAWLYTLGIDRRTLSDCVCSSSSSCIEGTKLGRLRKFGFRLELVVPWDLVGDRGG